MLTLEVNRQFVDPTAQANAADQYKDISPLLTPTQIQQQQLGSFIVDFLDKIDSARNKTALVDSFCNDCGQLLSQMIDSNSKIDPNHLDGLVDCAIKMLESGINTASVSQFATLLNAAKSKIVLPPVDSQTRVEFLLNKGDDTNPLVKMGYTEPGATESQSPAAEKFVLMFGSKPFSARTAA